MHNSYSMPDTKLYSLFIYITKPPMNYKLRIM